MTTSTASKINKNRVSKKQLEKKAALLDELVGFIEDKYLGYLMEEVEGEKNMSLAKAKKVFF